MKYRVLVFPSAEIDLLEIRAYFEETLNTSADKLIEKFQASLLPLVDTPFMHPLVSDEILAAKGFHSIVVDNYLIFYKVIGKVVQIHRFLYGKRLYSSLL